MTIDVKVYQNLRDGGTTIYIDSLNRLYYTYQYPNNPKVYNKLSNGSVNNNAQEIPIELNIVTEFV